MKLNHLGPLHSRCENLFFYISTQLEQKISRERTLALQLPQLSAQIVSLIKQHGRLNIGEIETMTRSNHNTLKKHLAKLVQMKTLLRLGKGKATWYTLS